ncbi:putative SNF2 family helicase [Aspergillus novofumigatus IBT 16806]|uniref:Putative SNF2 family helicase n=1 Tax=Aspergillus novofumigatus (strain IBT 16806) TaxID=1392255 RepID=A0A2I1CIA8_ASPN1|nr:putative SNF2 family helicase [Aspergillus novofumigatus IBT 16806]PKX97366.1 putative SNF2 family helicase [Aspergillus novofumigatus IBT 16806]
MDLDPPQSSDNMLPEPGPPELDINLSQLEDIDARRQQTASKAFFARSVLALRNNVPTTSLPNDTAAPPSTPEPSITCTAPAPFDNQLFVSQPADNTLDNNEIEQIRQFVASQNGNVSESNGLTAMSQEQDNVSTETSSGVTAIENLMNLDEPQPVMASSSNPSEAPDAPAVTGTQGSVDENDVSEWPEVQEEDSTGGRFDIIETWYNTLENPTLEETVQYEKAKQRETRRRERIASRKALEEAEQNLETFPDLSDDELLNPSLEALPGDTGKRSDMASANRPSKGPRKQKNRVSAAERRRSMRLGLDIALGRVTRKRGSGKKRSRKRKADDSDEDVPASGDVSKKNLFDPEFDLNAFLNPDVIADAQANAGLPAIPISNSKNKKSALAELVASIPSADQDQAKSDRQAILEATTKFRHKARSDGKGGWRIKGMKTSLFHHQLLGVAWMALANIVDGRCVDPDHPVKTTLIVVPPHLVGHWECQVVKHCEKDAVGDVLIYCAQSRMRCVDVIQSLQKFSVIITTYDEVRCSYPQLKRRGEVLDEKKIVEMWEELYAKEIGPLHQIKFLRIILDEGHFIKNHLASTSIAVRALTGHHKWILSGTPVPNFITEFYPHFDFLEYPDTNDYSRFVKRYCEGDEAQQRLRNLCRTYILLRTHSSRLFSLPIIKLPDIGESVIKVDFCDVERRIYDEVLEQFIANINGLSDDTNPYLAQCRCFLTMILKLRMISSHLLTTQNLVKGLLTSSLMRDLVEIARETRDPDHPSTQINKWFITLKKGVSLPAASPDNEDPSQSRNELNGDREELVKQFHKFTTELHEDGQWDERLRRTSCPHCELTPIGPIITSCMHLYCEECYFILKNRLTSADGKPICQICNTPIAEAAYCGTAERIVLDEPSAPSSLTQNNTRKTKPSSQKKSSRLFGSRMFATAAQRSRMKQTDDEQQNEDEELDWISATQGECLEGWAHCRFTGKMSIGARDLSMNDFREKREVKVMIASLMAGGTGLDMSMANKCILVDLWWNEAMQQQAFCRLYRIGQEKVVEIVKIIVQNTIDDYILQLQTKKSANINSTIGEEALQKRDKIIDLLKMFAEVEVQENGGIVVEVRRKGEQADKGDKGTKGNQQGAAKRSKGKEPKGKERDTGDTGDTGIGSSN